MKRIISLILVIASLLACAALLSSCGPDKATGFVVPSEGFDTSKPVTIKFYHTMGESLRSTLDIYIEKFQKLYPNITVVHEQVGSYNDVRDQLTTQLAVSGSDTPNIAYCYSDHLALYKMAGSVVTLDSLIESEIEVERADGTKEILGFTDAQIADFIPAYYEEGRPLGDGLMYSIPFSKSTEVLFYNKTFFDENGLNPPTTWAEMEEVCRQIKALDKDCIPLGYDSESNWFITMCEQYGSDYTSATGDHYLFDNKTNRDFVKMIRGWYENGYVTTMKLHGNTYTSSLFTATSGERSYMCIGSSAGATHQTPTNDAFEVGITSIPQVDPSKPKVISQGPSVCIFNKQDPQEVIASWLFVKYLSTSVEFQAEFSMVSGYVPVIKSVADNKFYKDFLDKANGYKQVAALSAKVCMEQADAYYTSPAFNGSSKARDEVGTLLTKCMSAGLSSYGGSLDALIDAAFKAAIEECEYEND